MDLRGLEALREANGETLPPVGGRVAIPYAVLNDDTKLRVIHDLFPADLARPGQWVHRAGWGRLSADEESLWNLALWMTGRGENASILAERNHLPGPGLRSGEAILIPGEILLPPFAALTGSKPAAAEPSRGSAPAATTPPSEEGEQDDEFTEAPAAPEAEQGEAPPAPSIPLPPAEGADQLHYGRDSEGAYAAYRLKRGEALYSAVVVRYTGRVDAQEVNDLARAIAKRSAVGDVTDIPIGYRIKIPLDLLLAEYLPPTDPRRLAWERARAEVARYTNQARSRNLQGVAVILDAGHGGRDQGAAHNGLWEHDYVYDILCRIKARLEGETGARVFPTIRDRKEGYAIHDTRRLSHSRAEELLTDPPFALKQPTPGVNLRWYLANSTYRRLQAEGQDPEKVVFASLHADARHPSLAGAMVYVPGEEFRRGRYGHGGAVYARYREVRGQPYVSFSRPEREQAEGLSRQFAATLVGAFHRQGVAVEPYRPIRAQIVRRGRSWVPAVLPCNEVPVEVLFEVSNLSNVADSRDLAEPSYRPRVADACVDALRAYYDAPSRPPRTAASRGRH